MAIKELLNVLETELEIKAYKYMQEIAQSITAEAKEVLENQSFKWKPLNPDYLEWKRQEGLDTRKLIATGFYQDHIDWNVEPGGRIWFGVENIIHDPSGLPLPLLARIHEFGSGDIPARPLWRPLLAKYLKLYPQFAKRYKMEVAKAANAAKKKLLKKKKVKVKL